MVVRHGKDAAAFIGQYNATSWLNSFEVNKQVPTADVTTFGNDAKIYIAGSTQDSQVSAGGFWDGDAQQIDLVLNGIADTGVAVPATWCPNGVAVGNTVQVTSVIETSYSLSSPMGGAVAVKWAGTTDGGAWWGKVLNALASITTTVTGTSMDNGVTPGATLRGGRLNVHVVSNSRTTAIDVKLQHSTDNSIWTDVSGGQQTVPAGVAISGTAPYGQPTGYTFSVTGTINRYVRCLITPVAGTGAAIITMAFARY